MHNDLQTLIATVQAWPEVTLHPHRFSGTEFRLGTTEIGHVHGDGTVDIPFPKSLREQLVAAGRAQKHHWLPDSGWTTVRLRQAGVEHAVQVLRLNYLRHALKHSRQTGGSDDLRDSIENLTRELTAQDGIPSSIIRDSKQ